MTISLRPIAPDELNAFHSAASAAFAESPEDEVDELRALIEWDRTLAAFDGGRIVGTGILLTFELTVPGGTAVPAGGVTWIGVLPTHRRRGILTSIMRRQLSDVRERGEFLAMLYASESIIYGRFGYGIATNQYRLQIEPRFGQFARSPAITGRVELIDKDEARTVLPALWEQHRLVQPGALTRSEAYWQYSLRDRESDRDGASILYFVVHRTDSDEIDGCVSYRVKHHWEHGFANNTMRTRNLITLTPQARAALWDYLLHHDLVNNIEAYTVEDEPLRWMLADPRRLRMDGPQDGLWIRLIDIPAALSARRYQVEDQLVIEVVDAFCPENSGCYRLEGGPDGAECCRTSSDPDLSLQVADLGATYLGGVRFDTLARAGRVEEGTSGALRRADLMFASSRMPVCATGF